MFDVIGFIVNSYVHALLVSESMCCNHLRHARSPDGGMVPAMSVLASFLTLTHVCLFVVVFAGSWL